MSQKKIKKKLVLKKQVKNLLSKVLISVIIFLLLAISTKQNNKTKEYINNKVYEEQFKFTKIRNIYEKYFGDILSLDKVVKETQPVFNEEISYQKKSKYYDGVELTVSSNYLVPSIEDGIVVFIGDKDNYGKTIIVEQTNGIDVFYSNVEPININIYDYIAKGEIVGEAKNNKLYLLFQKDGKFLDYKDYV